MAAEPPFVLPPALEKAVVLFDERRYNESKINQAIGLL